MALCGASALHLLFLGFDLDPRQEAAGERAGDPLRRRLERAAAAHLGGPGAVGRELPAVDVRGERRPPTIERRPVAVSAGAPWELAAPSAAGGRLPPRCCHEGKLSSGAGCWPLHLVACSLQVR